jgi:hypothetical protein
MRPRSNGAYTKTQPSTYSPDQNAVGDVGDNHRKGDATYRLANSQGIPPGAELATDALVRVQHRRPPLSHNRSCL